MSRWVGIIVHHSATSDTDGVEREAFDRYHRSLGWQAVGYHWIVERIDGDYQAIHGRPATMQGSHCPGKNQDHLGVCFAGNFHAGEMRSEQLIVGAELISSLCVMNDANPSNISRHSDYRDTACPGDLFPFDELVRMVRSMVGE